MIILTSIVFFITNLLVIVRTAPNNAKGVIGFPEAEEDPQQTNKQNRTPLFIPAMCPESELLYPGDQIDDWICDCRPGYIYHPLTDACWLAYQRGPCSKTDYLILPSNSVIPSCVRNPCDVDSTVMWNGKCEMLGSVAACGVNVFPSKALWINSTTLNIECIQISLDYRFSVDIIMEAPVPCAPGSKKYIQNKCMHKKT